MLFGIIVMLLLFNTHQAQAQPKIERTPLTLELLQTKLHNPILREGSLTVDLRDMTIDLRPENAGFRDEFYQTLLKELQKASATLGLDLSNSVIQGDFNGNDLGIRTTLYPKAISPTFTSAEQQQIERLREVCLNSLLMDLPTSRDCRSLLHPVANASTDINVFRGAIAMEQTRFNGTVSFANTFFLQSVDAPCAIFNQPLNLIETRFSRPVSFASANFRKEVQFNSSIFFDKANFKQAQFQEAANFQDCSFEENTNFTSTIFRQSAKLTRSQWEDNADFSQVRFAGQVQFTKANFNQFFLLTEATFEQAVTFREARFSFPVMLRNASILNLADFSDCHFTKIAELNVSGLEFNSNQAKILGNPGEIGKMLTVSGLQGNQNVLRNLVQNFRQLQQIADVNQLEYTKQQLRLLELSQRLFGISIIKLHSDYRLT